jgi:hypothetical protein
MGRGRVNSTSMLASTPGIVSSRVRHPLRAEGHRESRHHRKRDDRCNLYPVAFLDFDSLVAARAANDVMSGRQCHVKITRVAVGAVAFRNLTLVVDIEDPDTFPDYALGRAVGDPCAGETIDSRQYRLRDRSRARFFSLRDVHAHVGCLRAIGCALAYQRCHNDYKCHEPQAHRESPLRTAPELNTMHGIGFQAQLKARIDKLIAPSDFSRHSRAARAKEGEISYGSEQRCIFRIAYR